MKEIIRSELLTKHYRAVKAVSGLSLSVGEGEIYGFLGLNGAGKTTTIRMLLGMIRPSAGNAYISGTRVKPGENKIWEKTGHLMEVPYAYPDLTVRENLDLIRRLRFIDDHQAVDSIMDKLQISTYASRKAKNLSQGNAQRLGLAKALIHNPELLILDEPTNGLDPAGIVEIRELLTGMAANHGVTIFISSHILGEISRLATRIGIIHQGCLISEFRTDQLDNLCKKRLLAGATESELAMKVLRGNGFSPQITEEGLLELNEPEAIRYPENVAKLLVESGVKLTLLKVDGEDLEAYFLRTIGMKGGKQ